MSLDDLFRPVSARPLAALRVGLSLLLLVHLIWISGDMLSLHGSRGIIPWELANLERDPWIPGLPTLARALSPFGIGEHTAIVLLLSAYAGSLLSLALGWHARLSATVAWGLHVCLMTSGYASYYGVDQIAKTFLVYLVLFPSGRAFHFVSRSDSQTNGTIPVICLRVLQVHLSVVYLAAGLHKARGSQWWTGEAIWQTVHQPIFSTFDLRWMANHTWVPMVAGWITLVVEIGYVFFVWPRRTRTAWCFATIALHVGLAVFMGLVFFSSLMILLTTCLFLVPEDVRETVPVRVRRPVLGTLLVFAGLLLVVPSARADETGRLDDYPAIVRRVMERDRIPGVALGVVDRGRLVVARGFGARDLEQRLPVTPDTLFPLGSCSKAFTATALALLADEGKLDLDAPVRAYLPDFTLEDPVASATLTTRDILTHRSGLPRHDLFWYQASLSRDELYHRLRWLEPSGPPHAQWRYNSVMFVVAGRIVEKISGVSWERFVEGRILAPLGMRRTLLSPHANDPDRASPYALVDGRLRRMHAYEPSNAMAPAGGVVTSVRDLARWLGFHATRSPPILGEGMWRELHDPLAEMPASTEPEIRDPHYALGWVHETYRGHPLVFHHGAVDGFTVHVGFMPETGQGLVLLMNRDLASSALLTLAYSAYDRLLGLAPIDWERRLSEPSTPLLDVPDASLDFPIQTVVGRYRHPAYGSLTVRSSNGELGLEFRTHRLTLAYQGNRQFLSREPITDGAPQITVRFSDPNLGPPRLLVPLNFDDGDPVEVFTRVQ